ncbi:MAG: hypothetical protein K2J10_06405 [Muribaculaceae bacterium]|nr:hypothetical protein [Muribaculaceae bacterium]
MDVVYATGKIARFNSRGYYVRDNRYIDLYVKSAKERYDELVNKYEDIFSIFAL